MIWIVTGILLIILGCLIHFKLTKSRRIWKKRNIPYYEFLGPYQNIFYRIVNNLALVDEFLANYRAYPDKKCYGISLFGIPQLLIRDLELIRHITIKDFDHFIDHTDLIPLENFDKVLQKNLFALKGKQWHTMRAILSPSFTGSKMRGMFELMSACGDQLVHYLKLKCQKQQNGGPLEIEFKDLTTRVTSDIIATTAFGIKIDSLKEPNNEFYKMGRSARNISFLRMLLILHVPIIAKLFRLSLIPPNVIAFFEQIISDTIRTRREQNIVRPDMIHLLLEAQKEQIKHTQLNKDITEEITVLTQEDITAQALIFFFAGSEAIAVAMCFVSYELALNPDIQERLHNEIQNVLKSSKDGKITYDDLKKMKYLDMVVSESLRKWPAAPGVDRLCTKDYTIKLDDQEITIEKGQTVAIPIYGIHKDEKYFSKPEKFDPERFNDKNKVNIKSSSYMPFGIGPRQCIANRFALMEIKIYLIHLVNNFKLEVTKKTPIPMVFKRNANNLDAKDGFWIGVKARK